MANGSFHGDLLSDHKTTIVSLTHRMARMWAGKPGYHPQTHLPLRMSFLRRACPEWAGTGVHADFRRGNHPSEPVPIRKKYLTPPVRPEAGRR